jgi:hypothetical protein
MLGLGSPGRQQEVDCLAAAVDSAIKIHPLAFDLHIRLVHPPGAVAHAQVRPDPFLQFGRIGLNPAEDGGVVHRNAPIQQHDLKITTADREHQIPPDRPQNDLRGELSPFGGTDPAIPEPLVGASSSNRSTLPGSVSQSCNRTLQGTFFNESATNTHPSSFLYLYGLL